MTGDMVEEGLEFNTENGEKSEKKWWKMLEKWWKIKFWIGLLGWRVEK